METLAQVSRTLRILAEINRIIIHANDEAGLLTGICQAIVPFGYRLAWVGFAEPDQTIRIATFAGEAAGYVEGLELSWDENHPLGYGPTAQAIRSRKPVHVQDTRKDPAFIPWIEAAAHHQLASCSAFPLILDDDSVGAFVIYSGERSAFNEEEIRLWAELSDNLSFGIRTLRSREQRRRAEKALFESQMRFKSAFEYSSIGMALIDRAGRFLRVNEALCTMLGYLEEELLHKTFRDVTYPDDIPLSWSRYQRLIEGEISSYHWEKRYLTRRGRTIWINLSVSLVRDPDGQSSYSVAQIQDVTERKLAEQALVESEERYHLLYEHSMDAILITAPDGRVFSANSIACQMFRATAEELCLGGRDAVVDPSDPRLSEMLRQREAKGWAKGELTLRRHDGTLFPGELSSTIFHDRQGQRFTSMIIRDVSARKHQEWLTEERTRLQNEQIETLRESERLKDEFLSILSHELRTPLNAITGFGSFLADEGAGPLNPEQASCVAKMLQGTDRMGTLIEGLLDFASIKAGRFELRPEREDYAKLLFETVQLLKPLIEEKNHLLRIEAPPTLPVLLDFPRISQVLINLLVNAIKFTPSGGTITLRAFLDSDRLITEVEDTGIGLESEDLERIFSPFTQVDMSSTRQVGGVGLGLSISKGIVEAHGGSIVAESPGQGTLFRFFIPLVES